MALVNEHFLKLPNNYLFSDIAKKVNAFKVSHYSAAAVAGHGHKVQGHRNRHPLCQFAGKEYSAL